jgi:hypothetical protein
VANIAIAYLRLGQSWEEIAVEYDLTLAEVYAAIAFYYDNKLAIDESIRAAETCAESLRSEYPSLRIRYPKLACLHNGWGAALYSQGK